MPIYDEMIDKLEECLEDCCRDKIKPTDIELINEIVDAAYKLHKINMLEDVEEGRYGDGHGGEYGDYYPHYGDDGMHNDSGHSYGARRDGRYSRRRDSRGRYMGRYGHDKESMIKGLEEKMQNLNGEDQEVIRKAIKIVERR